MLCVRGIAALRSCPLVRGKRCRRGNCVAGWCAEISSNPVAGLVRTQIQKEKQLPQRRKGAKKNANETSKRFCVPLCAFATLREKSFDLLPLQWRTLRD